MARQKAGRSGDGSVIKLSWYQENMAAVPDSINIAALGGRSVGKSRGALLIALRTIFTYGQHARVQVIRRTFQGLEEWMTTTQKLVPLAFPDARLNLQTGIWRFGSGASMEIGILHGPEDFERWHGRSATLIIPDECQQWGSPRAIDLMRSNLRSEGDVPLRTIAIANPGGVGQSWIYQRWFADPDIRDWFPFYDKWGLQWVRACGTYRDNPFIDQAEIKKNLEASTENDPELRKAWVEGDFTSSHGAFFHGVLSQKRTLIKPWEGAAKPSYTGGNSREWEYFLAYDHGTASPAVCYVIGVSNGAVGADGKWYPRDSIVALDEFHTAIADDLSRGNGMTIPQIANEIKAMAEYWKIPARGVADPSIFNKQGHAAGSMRDEFARERVQWVRGSNSRPHGWSKMRALMAQAGDLEKPGIYITSNCKYFWNTVDSIPRHSRRPDDCDSASNDHGADALRYAVMARTMIGGGSVYLR